MLLCGLSQVESNAEGSLHMISPKHFLDRISLMLMISQVGKTGHGSFGKHQSPPNAFTGCLHLLFDCTFAHLPGLFSKVLCWFAKEGGESWVRWLLVCIPEDGRLRVGEGQCQGPAAGKALLAAAGSGQVPVLQCLLEAWMSLSKDILPVEGNSLTLRVRSGQASADVKTSDETFGSQMMDYIFFSIVLACKPALVISV